MKIYMQVPLNVAKVIRRLTRFGYQAFLVGGCIRDTLLDLTPRDWDIATDATPDEIKEVFDNCRVVGKRFPIAHILFKGEYIEVSTFRDRDGNFSNMLEDAYRRDFTVNALYYDTFNDEIIDPFTGVLDLKNKAIVCIGSPADRFREDPVRMLRAVRLSKVGFKMTPYLKGEVLEYSRLLATENPSRLSLEFDKMFDSRYNQSSTALTLNELKLLERFFPSKMWGGISPWHGTKHVSMIIADIVWDYYCELSRACVSAFNLYPISASEKAAKILTEELRVYMNFSNDTASMLKLELRTRYRDEYS